MIHVGEFREGMPLSELIQLAVNGTRDALATGKYVLNGERWHEPAPGGLCEICLGGGILARILRFDAKKLIGSATFAVDVHIEQWKWNAFSCLDSVRKGDVWVIVPGFRRRSEEQRKAVDKAGLAIVSAFDSAIDMAPLETYEAAAQLLAEVGL